MKATPVLFIHGFPLDARTWRRQVELLQAERLVLAPDLPGFGTNTRAPLPTSIEQHARFVIDTLDRAAVPRAVLVGLSMGGYIALALQRIAPERIAGLILCDTKATADTDEAKRGRTARIERIGRDGLGFVVDEMVHALVSPSCSDNVRLELRRILLEQHPEGVSAALCALRDRPDSTATLASIRVPTAILCGEADALTPPAVMRELASSIAHASFTVLPHAGHLSNMEVPDAFDRALMKVLACMP
jgi:3-oxoadipate enol-lactonase